MNRRQSATRMVQATVFAVAAALAAACGSTAAPTAPAADGAGGAIKGHQDIGPEIAAVKAATAQYHDVGKAIAAGYMDPALGVCDQIAIGTMGIHAGSPALLQSQAIDPAQPEVLLYLPGDDGFELVGVEWVQFVLLRDKGTGQVVGPWVSPDPWPNTLEIANPTPSLFGQTFQGPMAGHVPGMPWHWDLHAWVWRNNPNGMFAQWNPAISCS